MLHGLCTLSLIRFVSMFQMDPSQPVEGSSPPGSSPPGSPTPTTSSGKAQRRPRKPSVKPEGTWVVERVDEVIGIPQPSETLKKWRTSCGVIARSRVAITKADWSDVRQAERESLYAELKQSFRVPTEAEDAFRRATLLTMGKCWRNFKHRLVTGFMKKNKSPLGVYPQLSEADWTEFCRLKSSEEFQAESLKGAELSKKNKHPHILGTSGYVGAKRKWEKEDEEAEKYGVQPAFSDFSDERIRQWCRARTKPSASGGMVWHSSEEEEVYKRMVELNEQASQGSFVPLREKDILSTAIGTKEPTGRTRGVGNLATWGKAFVGDRFESRMRRRMAKKDERAQAMKEEIKLELQAEYQADFQRQLRALEERLASQSRQEMGPAASHGARRSSCASAPDDGSHPIDSLTGPAQCIMQIKFATMDFSMDAAYGRVFPSPPGKELISNWSSCRV